MTKRKKNTSKKKSKLLKIIAWILAVVVLIMASVAIGYLLGYDQASRESAKIVKIEEANKLALLQKQEKKQVTTQNTVNARLIEVLQKENNKKEIKKKEIIKVKSYTSASHEYEVDSLAKPPSRVKREVSQTISHKPKLAIIIDDVSVKSQVNAIKSLGLNITMSFLPPSAARPNSAKLASQEDFYMVHLPMEAQSFSAEEPNTLRINNTQKEISARVQSIKKLFPKVKYINNHTGSKYTQNEIAMHKLIVALNASNIRFLDSRTTAKTKAPIVMKNFGLKYVARDIFLDHHMEKDYVITQIKKSIKIAKSEGLAIAIGHPHVNTILALHESKKLFKDVDLVLINKVY